MPNGNFVTQEIPLRDGVSLVADVFLPLGAGLFPAVLELTPYLRRSAWTYWRNHTYWTSHGYALVIADTRGRGDSGGEFVFFRKEGDDGYDVVEWIAHQSWSTGKVAMIGGSYTGTNQWYVARQKPPHLTCINPNSTVSQFMKELCYQGGAYRFQWAMTWPQTNEQPDRAKTLDWNELLKHRPLITADEAAGSKIELHREHLSHPTYDEFWRGMEITADELRSVQIPSLSLTGWFDGTLEGTIDYFTKITSFRDATRRHFLIIGPWDHDTSRRGGLDRDGETKRLKYGDLTFPEHALIPATELVRRFFDEHLKDEGHFVQPPVQLYLSGSDKWLDFDSYPPASTTIVPLYLCSKLTNSPKPHGKLSWVRPATCGADRFTHDPTKPVPSRVGDLELMGQPQDISVYGDRDDVLVYRSAPLGVALTILGRVVLTLSMSSTARDVDVVVRLADVYPDGRIINLGPCGVAVQRARYREGLNRESLIKPDEPFDIVIDLGNMGHSVLMGHALELHIMGSAYPWIHVNPGTGNPVATDTDEPLQAVHTILFDSLKPPHLLLPVLKG